MADLELVLLGKPLASRNGTPLPGFAYNKSLALLAYLAMTGVPHSRDELAGMLWGEMPDQSARANLRKVLSELNDALPSHLTVTRQAVALHPQSSHWVDAVTFQARLQTMRRESGRVMLNDHEIRLMSEAVELYRGDFLAGFYVRDAPAFEEWVLTQREHYRQLLLNALHSLARHYTAQGAYEVGIEYTTRLLAFEPWQEEYHQQMMVLLALSGQRGAAIRQYETCRALLSAELGVEPSADTVALFKRILADQLAVPQVPVAPPHNLPIEVTPFIGRQAELQAVGERLNDPHCRLLTLVGMSGSGKTRLALHAACESLAAFRDGSIFVEIDATAPAGLPLAISRALSLHTQDSQDVQALLLAHLRDKCALLVLDGMERVLDAGGVPLLMEILRCAPGVKILTTSLERLAVEGEWVLPIRGLDLPSAGRADSIASSGAAQLFVAGALRAQSGFSPSQEELDAIARICHAVDGLPLAIELASQWVQALSVQEIAQEVLTHIDFLATASRSLPERHRSLAATLAYSCRRLGDEEQRVLGRLSVFKGDFGREAAREVAGASLPILAQLIDRGLLQRTSLGRYAMHRAMREYATVGLATSDGDRLATRDRHCLYYLAELQQQWQQWRRKHDLRVLDVILSDIEDIESAWQWALNQSSNGLLERFTAALGAVVGERLPETSPAWHSAIRRIDALLAQKELDYWPCSVA